MSDDYELFKDLKIKNSSMNQDDMQAYIFNANFNNDFSTDFNDEF